MTDGSTTSEDGAGRQAGEARRVSMPDERTYSLAIGDLADATGESVHTLRYYENVGLIPAVERNEAGHRRFADEHVKWVGLLDRLRASGMSVARMREYAELAERGDETVEERKALLRTHEKELRARIAELEQCLGIVQAKIDLYAGRISDPDVVWEMVEEARRAPPATSTDGVRQPL